MRKLFALISLVAASLGGAVVLDSATSAPVVEAGFCTRTSSMRSHASVRHSAYAFSGRAYHRVVVWANGKWNYGGWQYGQGYSIVWTSGTSYGTVKCEHYDMR